jgi:hypothetical protein
VRALAVEIDATNDNAIKRNFIFVYSYGLSGSSVRLAQHRRRVVTRAFRLLVALLPGRDLLLCAKYLFVAARTVWRGQRAEAKSYQIFSR